jgi:hypothetical protein
MRGMINKHLCVTGRLILQKQGVKLCNRLAGSGVEASAATLCASGTNYNIGIIMSESGIFMVFFSAYNKMFW